jgi:deoxyribodipyrimidine photolyase-related protein
MEIWQESDYFGSGRHDPKKKHGEAACPFNAFYWDYCNRHRGKLAARPRIGMMHRTWDRMAADERKRVLQQAEIYRQDLNRL